MGRRKEETAWAGLPDKQTAGKHAVGERPSTWGLIKPMRRADITSLCKKVMWGTNLVPEQLKCARTRPLLHLDGNFQASQMLGKICK